MWFRADRRQCWHGNGRNDNKLCQRSGHWFHQAIYESGNIDSVQNSQWQTHQIVLFYESSSRGDLAVLEAYSTAAYFPFLIVDFIFRYVLAAYVLVSFTLFVMARFSPYEWKNPHRCAMENDMMHNQFSVSNSFWFITGTFLRQVGFSLILVFSSWSFTSNFISWTGIRTKS